MKEFVIKHPFLTAGLISTGIRTVYDLGKLVYNYAIAKNGLTDPMRSDTSASDALHQAEKDILDALKQMKANKENKENEAQKDEKTEEEVSENDESDA